MSDIIDIANERIERETEAALAKRHRFTGFSLSHCAECSAEIPALRQQLLPGVQLCVECQMVQERRA